VSIKECIKLAAYNIIRKKTVSFQIAISFRKYVKIKGAVAQSS